MAFELKTKIWLLPVNERGGVGKQKFYTIYWHWNMSDIYQIVDKGKLQKEHTEYDHMFW